VCKAHEVFAVFGLLEKDGDRLFNACALVGPQGLIGVYRKTHLLHLGVDRFTTPGDKPFQVFDLGGLRVGMLICFDGSIPEAPRVLTLLGADLIVLPTNWPEGAMCSAEHLPPVRAMENHVYFLAVNRVGTEKGFTFVGRSRLVDCGGSTLAEAEGDQEGMFYAEIDPDLARQKRVVIIPGAYELDRIASRRPEFYGPLMERTPS
jgi:predicted amidohydrolase